MSLDGANTPLRRERALARLDGVDMLGEPRRGDGKPARLHPSGEVHAVQLAPQNALHRRRALLRRAELGKELSCDQVAPLQVGRHRVEAVAICCVSRHPLLQPMRRVEVWQLQLGLGRVRVTQPREHRRVKPRAMRFLLHLLRVASAAEAAVASAVASTPRAFAANEQQRSRDHLAVRHYHLPALATEEPAYEPPGSAAFAPFRSLCQVPMRPARRRGWPTVCAASRRAEERAPDHAVLRRARIAAESRRGVRTDRGAAVGKVEGEGERHGLARVIEGQRR